MIIHGRSLTSHSFATALHAALRVLVDDLECPSFNAAVGATTHQTVDDRLLTTSHDKTGQVHYVVRQGQGSWLTCASITCRWNQCGTQQHEHPM
jgi:hypothetical protein